MAAARLEHLLAAAAAEIHPILASATKIVVPKLLLHVGVVVFDALTMFRIVLPVVSAGIDIDGPIDVDVVVAPIASAAPIISARCPTPERIAGAKRNSARDDSAGDISGRREIVWRIRRIGPPSVHDGRIVIRHVDRVGLRRLNNDDLLCLAPVSS